MALRLHPLADSRRTGSVTARLRTALTGMWIGLPSTELRHDLMQTDPNHVPLELSINQTRGV
jgi:hypothetical protein